MASRFHLAIPAGDLDIAIKSAKNIFPEWSTSTNEYRSNLMMRIAEEISKSKLQGRGGAAFPTGRKWDAVAKSQVSPRYVVCNADESEPGTFKDRVLMEEDPFAIIESMTIAGFAVGAEEGYLYVRGEYPLATTRLEHAIQVCQSEALLGSNVMGGGFNFDIELRRGAGAYICGEETALFNSIEGFRGEPRNKPP